jgi:propane monooxygenase reductase subunit
MAGGAGLAPVLGLLRAMADRGIERAATFYYGVRGVRDLCFETELKDLADRLPKFRYVPALSDAGVDDVWDGEVGFVTDVVRRLEGDLAGRDVYLCGPPPMVEAALPLLTELGVRQTDIFFDKFTTTGEAEGEDGP